MRGKFSALSIAALGAAMLVCLIASPAVAQDLPSVSVRPADTTAEDPNFGQWFFTELNPGESGSLTARITSVADVPQSVKLYLADVEFSNDGRISVRDRDHMDVGLWGRFAESSFVIEPRQSREISFEIVVPKNADPGDHVGALVAETSPHTADGINIIKRVATRLYVTVPGDAIRAFEISMIRKQVDSALWPRTAVITVNLRNTGRIRLHPQVSVRGSDATGPEVLLSQSVETYIASIRIPWYGGYIKLPTIARGDDGLIRRIDTSMFVIPWFLLFVLVTAGGIGWLAYRWYGKHASRLALLHADIRRLEALVAQRPTGPTEAARVEEDEVDEVASLLGAIKRARRSSSNRSLPKLALSLHATGADALEVLLEALPHASETERADVIKAIKSHGADARSHPRFQTLPAEFTALLVPRPRARATSKRKAAPPKRATRKPVTTSHRKRS